MDEKKVILSPLYSLSGHYKRKVIKVSNNPVACLKHLTRSQTNLILSIVCAMQSSLRGSVWDGSFFPEITIHIPPEYISGHHSSALDQLLPLMGVRLTYAYQIPGYSPVDGVTSMVSSIEYRDGRYHVTIPGHTVTWIVYCGHEIGYVNVELSVILKMTHPAQMLYLTLLSTVDSRTHSGIKIYSIEEVREILGLGHTWSFSSINQKYLQTFPIILEKLNSRYKVQITPISTSLSSRRGRRAITEIDFCLVQNCIIITDRLRDYVQSLHRYWVSFARERTVKGCPQIAQEIEYGGFADRFIAKMDRVLKRKQSLYEIANIAKKILLEDFDITIYNSGN